MASEKKPSIYYDRGTVGSSTELDEYGVWVKSEPTDLSVSDPENSSIEEDFSIENMVDDLAEEPAEAADAGESVDALEAADAGESVDSLEIPAFGIDEALPELPEFSTEDFIEDPIEDAPEDAVETEEGFTEVSIEDFPEDTADTADSPDIALNLPALDTPAGDVSALDVPAEPQSTAELVAEAASRGSPQEFSTQLLIKIADELASIRNELSTLKNELSAIRPGSGFGLEPVEKEGEKIPMAPAPGDLTLADIAEDSPLEFATEDEGEGSPLDGVDLSPADEAAPDELALTDAPFELPPLEEEADTGIPVDEELEDISLDDLSFDDDAFAEPDLGPDISLDESETPVSIDLDLEESPAADAAGGDSAADAPAADEEELELSIPEFAAGEPPSSPSPEDAAEIGLPEPSPTGIPDLTTDNTDKEENLDESSLPELAEESLGESSLPELADEADLPEESLGESSPLEDAPGDTSATEENFAQVIPEGFVVEEEEAVEEILPELAAEDAPAEFAIEDEAEGSPLEFATEGEDGGSPLEFAAEAGLPEESLDPSPLPEPEARDIPDPFKQELKTVLSYMDQLLESLPEDKIEEFAKSEYFDTYKKLFKELGIV